MSHPTSATPPVNGKHRKAAEKDSQVARGTGPMLTAALDYDDLGWTVVPLCHPEHKGSHPPTHAAKCTRPGKQAVRKMLPLKQKPFSRAELATIWQRNPLLNVGVLTGLASKLVMVDVDVYEAVAAWRGLAGPDGTDTWVFASGKGLPHYLYCWPYEAAPKGLTLHHLHPKLDFLGEGVLSVMPPSLHKSGGCYSWIRGGPDSGATLRDFPLELLDLMTKAKPEDRPPGGGISAPPPSSVHPTMRRVVAYLAECQPAVSGEGGRAQTFKVACKLLHGFGLSIDQTVSMLLADWNARCEPPWSMADLIAEVEGAAQRGHCPRIEERWLDGIKPTPPVDIRPPVVKEMSSRLAEPLPGRPASQLRPKTLSYLLAPYVANSTLTMLVGRPNTGKSTFLAYLATLAKRTLYLPGYEEDADLNLFPRLQAHKAALDGIHVLDAGDWKMPHARERLCRVAKQHGSDLIVVDPVTSYLAEGASENDAQAVRLLLEGYLKVATETGAAVVCVRHPGKDPNNVMRGSGAWREVPRNIVELMMDMGPPRKYLIRFEKDGYGNGASPREYDLLGQPGCAKVFKLGDVMGEEDGNLLRDVPDQIERLKIDQAADLLACLLADGPKESKFVFGACEGERLSERTVRNAARRIGIDIKREGSGNDHRSYWSLPDVEPKGAESSQKSSAGGVSE